MPVKISVVNILDFCFSLRRQN